MKPTINLCVFNHLRLGILDQIWFAEELFIRNGYELICTSTLRPDCLNLLIENFVESDAELLDKFCRKFNKQIGIVMSEHIELKENSFTFNAAPLEDTGYIGNMSQRLFSLLSLDDCIFGFFTMGELPELRTWHEIIPNRRVYRLPYPSIRKRIQIPLQQDFDLIFTGQSTTFRRRILKDIAQKYRLLQSDLGETEEERARLYARAKVALNIPQHENWPWISPMRVIFGLRVGIPTVHLGQRDATMFTKAVIDPIELDHALNDHDMLFRRQIGSYENLVQSEDNFRFPEGLFGAWADAECLS
jgi:hypothetical protein